MGLTRPRAYQIFDIDYKQSVRVVTVSNVTLSGGAPNQVDGVNLSLNDRVLVTGQNTGSQNGLYYVTTVGTGSNGTWVRSVDGNQTGEIDAGMIVMVTEGTIYADTQWKLTTNDPIVIGTTALTFVQNYSANSISAGTSNVVVNSNANVTISSAGTPNVLTVSSTGTVTSGTASVSGNITGGNLLTAGLASVTGNITGGNLNTGAQVVATGNITGGNLNTGAQVVATGNITGGNLRTSGVVSATGTVSGLELTSTNSSGSEGGQINLAQPASGSTLAGGITIDAFNNLLRFFEQGGTARGAYIDITSCAAGVGTNLLAGSGGGTPGGANTQVQFNDAGTFGGNAQFTYDKVTNTLTAGIISANNNGNGTNFRVGDDVWIGDINTADTMSVRGQQNAANGYIVFGNADSTGRLGRAGTGPLTYAGAFSATGNVTGGNILTGGIISATGNVSGGNVAAATALFSLGTVGATGNITGGNILTAGLISATGNITGGNVLGGANVNATTHTGTTVSVTANITGGNILTAGLISATGNITGGNVLGGANVNATTHTGTTVSVTANITGGNILTGGLISATGNVTGGNVVTAGAVSAVTGVVTGNITGGNILTAGLISATGNITVANLNLVGNIVDTGALSIITSANGNISLSPNGTGNVNIGGNIMPVANATANIGSATLAFNTIFARATSAQYADLAEMYVADADYSPGTVLEFGGDYEVTITVTSHSTAVAGIVSTNPSYLMNSTQDGEHVVAVALTGRVPCRVLGPVKKGDVLVSSTHPGVAQRIGINWQPGCVIGKAMQNITESKIQTIEVAVGRL